TSTTSTRGPRSSCAASSPTTSSTARPTHTPGRRAIDAVTAASVRGVGGCGSLSGASVIPTIMAKPARSAAHTWRGTSRGRDLLGLAYTADHHRGRPGRRQRRAALWVGIRVHVAGGAPVGDGGVQLLESARPVLCAGPVFVWIHEVLAAIDVPKPEHVADLVR